MKQPPVHHRKTTNSPFLDGIMTQVRVIKALILREILTRFGDRQLGYVWVMVEPLIQVAIFVGLRTLLGLENVRDVHVVPFLVTGIIPFYYFRHVVAKVMRAVHSNRGLLVFAQIRFVDLFYARFLLETATYITIFMLAAIVTDAYIVDLQINNISASILSFLMLGYCGFAFGVFAAAIIPVFDAFQSYVNIALRILYFVSGILFAMTSIPQEYHALIAWNPVVHGIELFRYNFLEGFHPIETFMNGTYVLTLSTIVMLLGFILVRRLKKWILR